MVIAIIGPTGVGKSRLAIHLARLFNGEIVIADSRQVYRYMDIGTAKPTAEEMGAVPHHLIDIVPPDEDFSLARYQQMAYSAIDDITRRSKLPFLVGGSGLYIWAVLEGWQIPRVAPDLAFRRDLERRAASGESGDLYQELVALAPALAQRIDPRNVRRVIRALEVQRLQASVLPGKVPPAFKTLIVGLTVKREELYRRIDRRVDMMIKRGLVGEVEKLVRMGYDFTLSAMSGIGYKQIGKYLKGGVPLENAIAEIKFETHRFVRHQYAWFRLSDSRVHWFDASGQTDDEVTGKVGELITKQLEGARKP